MSCYKWGELARHFANNGVSHKNYKDDHVMVIFFALSISEGNLRETFKLLKIMTVAPFSINEIIDVVVGFEKAKKLSCYGNQLILL